MPTVFEPDRVIAESSDTQVTDPIETLRNMGVELPAATVTDAACGPVWTARLHDDDRYANAALWSSIREAHPRTGWWPILAGPHTAAALSDSAEPPTAGDGAAWLSTQATAALADLPSGAAQPVEQNDPDAFDWMDALSAHDRDFDRLMLVPARAGWLVPGMLGWLGATNVDVLGNEHATMLRRWAGRWGSELIGLERDVLTLRVSNPPIDADEALTAATEAALYCSDAVCQGTGTIWALAPAMTMPLWTFWWD